MDVLLDLELPKDLTERDQWLWWRYTTVKGRETKVPCDVSGRKIDNTDPRNWHSVDQALETFKKWPRRYAGIGYSFASGGGQVGVDLDDCLVQGEPKKCVWGILERFSDTYMEISPSGEGIKLFCRGSLPANLPGVSVDDGISVEMYDHGRFFTVTGRRWRGSPLELEEHTADLKVMYDILRSGERKAWPLQPLQGGRIPYGQQHSTLVSIVGTLRARRVCDAAIEACLLAINEHQCERPGPTENIRRMVRSTRAWGTR